MTESATGSEQGGLRRRELLIAGAAAGATLAAPINYAAIARGARVPPARDGRFASGVMSGVPSPRAITLWTRLGEVERSSRIRLEVATDKAFRNVVKREDVVAEREEGFTAHARIKGLRPQREYFYRFATRETSSRIGRFRTAPPPDSKQKVRIAFYSCQDYEAGFFNAQRAIAREDVDLVVCIGDYIYETSFYQDKAVRRDRTGNNSDGDVQRLSEYREKYELYQRTPGLRQMHAAHPFVAIWDDHEVEDNYAGDDPDEANGSRDQTKVEDEIGPRRVPFARRRKNGYRAFFEAMPRFRPRRNPNQIFGSLRLGKQCEIFLMDQRQYRDPQPCDDQLFVPCPEYSEPRTLLGERQKQWLKRGVAGSDARWKVLGNQLVMFSIDTAPTQHLNPDQWDGYAIERGEILEHLRARGTDNIVALTGDIHTFFAGTVTTNGNSTGDPVATEFVGGSATSLGIPETFDLPPSIFDVVRTSNPHIEYTNFEKRGYGILELGAKEATCEFKSVDALKPSANSRTLAKFRVAHGVPGPQPV